MCIKKAPSMTSIVVTLCRCSSIGVVWDTLSMSCTGYHYVYMHMYNLGCIQSVAWSGLVELDYWTDHSLLERH